MRMKRYDVRAWIMEDAPISLRRQAGRSGKKGFNEGYHDLEKAQKRCEALRQAGYFCWVHDTQEDLNVSPYLPAPIPMTRKTR